MNERQLERSLEIGFFEIAGLKAFDHAILAAVLGRSEEISSSDQGVELSFCELDGDLQPWFKKDGKRRSDLCDLYDPRGIWVYGDFEMTRPHRPAGWPAETPL